MSNELLEGLNPQQHAAVTAGNGPVLVLAGPGSGKTGVLTRRVAYLIRAMDVKPWHIMAVTFTNKAAAEMKSRIYRFLGEPVPGLQIGTFHATCAKILRIENQYTPYGQDYVIYDSDDQKSVVKTCLETLNIDAKKFNPRRIQNAISNAKNEMILPDEYVAQDYFGEMVKRVYPLYQKTLLSSNAMDFDDLLLNMVLVLRDHADLRTKYQERYPFVLVDEFQDTNTVQYQLVSLFAMPQNNVFVVGDEDQSIYAFRGADYRNVSRFRNDHPSAQVVLLEQNYRSTQVVLDVARAVIDRNHNRTPKALFTDRQGGDPVVVHEAYDDDYEARFVMETIEDLRRREGYDYTDFAIMYRTNAQSRALEDVAVRMSIPYALIGGVSFYGRREVRDLLAYLRLIQNPDDRVSLERIINTPKRGIGKKSVQDFQNWAAQQGIGYGEALERIMAGDADGLSGRIVTNFAKFGTMLQGWRELAKPGDLAHLLDTIRSDTGYTMYIHNISDTPHQAADREDNIGQLRGLLAIGDDDERTLGDWLQEKSLETDTDLTDTSGDKVTMLTLHAAKGLEYPVIFITGVEDGLIPHSRAFDEPDGLEEERRLFYVGLTRAEDRLFITHAFKRVVYGGYSDARERSLFLADLPPEHLHMEGGNSLSQQTEQMKYRRMTSWDGKRTGLDRLKQDLRGQRDNTTEGHVSKEDVRGKIIPFPGGNVSNDPLVYKSGMKVSHPVFGAGTVITSERVDQDEQVTVAFLDKRYGIKKISAEYANLTIQ